MSRVAKAPIKLPAQVEILIEKNSVTVKGPKGELKQHCNHLVQISPDDNDKNVITFKPATEHPNGWAQAGTMRAIVNNMVHGVTKGYELSLELIGVGYRAQSKGTSLGLSLGYSHPIEYNLPKGVSAETPSNTVIVLKGIDKQLIGQVASEIRAKRPPEPYKGKGVRKLGEVIVCKETKKK